MADESNTPSQQQRTPLVGELVPQPGGRGYLRYGNPGNRARGASATREAMRLSLDKRLPALERIADGKPQVVRKGKGQDPEIIIPTITERLRAYEILGRYGLDVRTQGMDLSEVRDKVAATLDVLRRLLPPELAVQVVGELRPIWRTGAAA